MTKDNFLNNLARCLQIGSPQDFADRMQRFYVEDLTADENVRVILVCESPHTCEIEENYPLAGNSGKDVTATLARLVCGRREGWDEPMPHPWNQPIGKLVKCKDPCFRWLGIMNVCPIPMQKNASDNYSKNIPCNLNKAFETIRNSPGAQSRDCRLTNCIELLILEHFQCEITSVCARCQDILVFPCGEVAEAFLDKSGVDARMLGVPHPSRGQWVDSLRRAEKIKEMSREIRGILSQ